MMKKVVGVILSCMLILSACSFPGSNKTNQNATDQSATETSKEEDAAELEMQKNHESQLFSKFQELADETFPEKIQRSFSWETKECSENATGTVIVPVISEDGMQDLSWFSDDLCDWVEICLNEIPYKAAPWFYKEIVVYVVDSKETFELSNYVSGEYDRETLYNGIYAFVDEKLNSPKSQVNTQSDYEKLAFDKDASTEDYSDYAADCSYTTQSGINYEMIPVDRAAGSNYYILISYQNGKRASIVVNDDPFCGSGGQALWITFIDDTSLGFACLTYNGGDDALLFRTTDGGRSFAQINYPSAKVKLSDGTVYNPFVIPKEVWIEDGNLYMLVDQSQYSGDYYSEELDKHPSGLYVSHDDGASFEYVGEQ